MPTPSQDQCFWKFNNWVCLRLALWFWISDKLPGCKCSWTTDHSLRSKALEKIYFIKYSQRESIYGFMIKSDCNPTWELQGICTYYYTENFKNLWHTNKQEGKVNKIKWNIRHEQSVILWVCPFQNSQNLSFLCFISNVPSLTRVIAVQPGSYFKEFLLFTITTGHIKRSMNLWNWTKLSL